MCIRQDCEAGIRGRLTGQADRWASPGPSLTRLKVSTIVVSVCVTDAGYSGCHIRTLADPVAGPLYPGTWSSGTPLQLEL